MSSFLQNRIPQKDSEPLEPDNRQQQSSDNQPEQQEYISIAARSENVRKTTYLLAALFGTGLLGLWFMIRASTPKTASAIVADTTQAQIELAIRRLGAAKPEMFSDMNRIVKTFYEFSKVHQVKTHQLRKNPFRYEMFLGNLSQVDDNEQLYSGQFIGSQSKQQRLIDQANKMRLFIIMATKTGKSCMIDDKTLRVGDEIKGFRVRKIFNRYVQLECDDIKVNLKLPD